MEIFSINLDRSESVSSICDNDLVESLTDTEPDWTPFFVDSVSAGFPSPATDYLENKLDLNEYLVKHPAATYIVKANGSSMVDAGILSGDLLIVDRSVTPRNESIVIASIFGDLTVKKIRKKNTSLFLVSDNSDYPSIEVQ